MSVKKEGRAISQREKRARAKSSTRRQRRPSLNNEQLLDRALDLFLEQGFERTSIDAITAAAGMAKRTVYLRYGDKKSLFKAALQRAIDQWIVPVEKLRASESASLEETLLAIGRLLVDNILTPEGLRLLHLTNAESVHMPEIGVYTVQQGTEPTVSYLADLFLRHLGPNGTKISDAEDAAEAFLHLVVGGPANSVAWGAIKDKDAIDRRTRFSVRLFLHGLFAQLGGSDAASPGSDIDAENQRLKKLLAETMVQLDLYQERLANRLSTDGEEARHVKV